MLFWLGHLLPKESLVVGHVLCFKLTMTTITCWIWEKNTNGSLRGLLPTLVCLHFKQGKKYFTMKYTYWSGLDMHACVGRMDAPLHLLRASEPQTEFWWTTAAPTAGECDVWGRMLTLIAQGAFWHICEYRSALIVSFTFISHPKKYVHKGATLC